MKGRSTGSAPPVPSFRPFQAHYCLRILSPLLDPRTLFSPTSPVKVATSFLRIPILNFISLRGAAIQNAAIFAIMHKFPESQRLPYLKLSTSPKATPLNTRHNFPFFPIRYFSCTLPLLEN